MTAPRPDSAGPSIDWDAAAPGAEFSATVIMASGFALPEGQKVRERYRVASKLGKGGMGQVLAVSLVGGDDHQSYALKVVARPAPDEAHDAAAREEADQQARWFADLLRREAAKQDVVQRHGVSVARLFALVQLDDGSLGLRMELARGRSLEERIDDEAAGHSVRPDVHFAVVAARKLMTQLRRLHEVSAPGSPFGFIHSDIKPGNVFLDDHDKTDPQVTLLDFGVATAGQAMARGLQGGGHGGRKTLVLEQAGGTIGYAPPGHFAGAPTPLSDVFAAMVILYELVTGEMPWDFTGVRRDGRDLGRVEALMRTRPRRVSDVRPAIPADQAEVLDSFFSREFGALQTLSDLAPAALDAPDRAVQRAMVERLSTLARDYQSKLDELLAVLPARGAASPFAPATDPRAVGSRPSARPTMPSAPSRDAADAAALDPPSAPRPRVASRAPTEFARAPERRGGGGGGGAWALLLFLLLGAGGAYYVYSTRPAPASPPAPTPAPAPEPTAAPDVLVAAPPPPAIDAAAAVAPPPDASVARACECLADAPGTLVVAHGGTLERDIVLCAATTVIVDAGVAQYFGRGTIAPEVVAAFPEVSCRAQGAESGRRPQRSMTAAGGATLFRCRLPRWNEDAGPPLYLSDAGAGFVDAAAAEAAAAPMDAGDAGGAGDAGDAGDAVPPAGTTPGSTAPQAPAARPAPRRPAPRARRAPARRRHHTGGSHRRGRRRR